jgi:hypothetical protein
MPAHRQVDTPARTQELVRYLHTRGTGPDDQHRAVA